MQLIILLGCLGVSGATLTFPLRPQAMGVHIARTPVEEPSTGQRIEEDFEESPSPFNVWCAPVGVVPENICPAPELFLREPFLPSEDHLKKCEWCLKKPGHHVYWTNGSWREGEDFWGQCWPRKHSLRYGMSPMFGHYVSGEIERCFDSFYPFNYAPRRVASFVLEDGEYPALRKRHHRSWLAMKTPLEFDVVDRSMTFGYGWNFSHVVRP